jgi:hypothetical protein
MERYEVTYRNAVVREDKELQTEDCNSITFTNVGQAVATVSDIPLAQYEKVEFENCDPRAIIKENFTVVFAEFIPAFPGEQAPTKQLVVIKKFTSCVH